MWTLVEKELPDYNGVFEVQVAPCPFDDDKELSIEWLWFDAEEKKFNTPDHMPVIAWGKCIS